MALGTFSGGGLGMGVAFVLEDYFSKTADTIERRMGQLGGYTEQMADRINRAQDQMKIGAGMMAVGAAILAPFVSGIKNASDLEENINKNRVAFGAYSAEVEAFASKSLDTFGVDKIQALDMSSLFGDMATGMGMQQDQAAKMSMSLVGLAGDLSSFKNISSEMSQTALKGIFTGETESLKGLGIIMNEANLQSFMATQGINKNFKDLSQTEKVMTRFNFVMAMSKNAVGDFARTSEGYANSKRVFEGSLKEVSATLGQILMPVVAKVFQSLSGLMKSFRAFAESPMGKSIMLTVVALGVFLVVGGLTLLLMGGMKFMAYKMAEAFGASTKAKIIETIATKGLSAGLREMGVAAWASIGPFILIAVAIAAFVFIAKKAWDMVADGDETMVRFGVAIFALLGTIGWIIGAVVGIRRGFQELDEWKGDKGGVIGFFMRVAGVISAVSEIWQSFNGETFTLSEELASKLEAMGILDFVLEIGTWVSRIKMFFMELVGTVQDGIAPIREKIGAIWEKLVDGIGSIFEKIGGVWEKLKVLFAPIIKMFETLMEKLGLGKGALSDWGSAGEIVGNAILFILNLVVDSIGVVIDTILWLADMWVTSIDYMVQGIMWIIDGIGWVVDGIVGWIDMMWSLTSLAFDVGVSFMTNIWEGLKSVWELVWAWLSDTVGAAMNMLSNPLGAIGDGISSLFGGDSKDKPVGDGEKAQKGAAGLSTKGTQGHHMGSSKAPVVNNNNNNSTTASGGTTIVQNFLDGDLISEKVIEKQELKAARS